MKIVNFLYDIIKTTQKFELDHDCFSYGQLQSKYWIVEELKNMDNPELGKVFVLCGWYGILPAMLLCEELNIDSIRSFDRDEPCSLIADEINKTHIKDQWKFKAVTEDINNIDFEKHTWEGWSNVKKEFRKVTDIPDTIINTSCEHTYDDWYSKIPPGKIVILQSNDFYEGNGHINCCKDFKEFNDKYSMTTDYYHGARTFEKYNRFMKIGVK